MTKILTLTLGATILGAMLTGCDSRAKLAESVQGEWTGNPEMLLDTGAATASLVRMLEFTAGTTDTEGTVTMTALITVENTMQLNDSLVSPLQITSSGNATITGVYQAKDDDDLTISLDVTSMSVNVDPDGVQLNYNVVDGQSSPSVEKLRPGAVVLATQQINRAAQNVFSNITEIEDIHVKGSIMTCEINVKNLIFTKGGVPSSATE